MNIFNFFKNKKGIAMVDYVLIVSLISVISMAALQEFGDVLFKQHFNSVSSAIEKALTQHEMEMADLENMKNMTNYNTGNFLPGSINQSVIENSGIIFEGDWIGSVDSVKGTTGSGGQYGQIEGHNNHLPVAKFHINKNPIGVGITAEILNISSDPEGCKIVKADWGGTYPANNTWMFDGEYVLKLRVADEYGNWSDWYSEVITVTNDPPVAVLTSEPNFQTLEGKDLDVLHEKNTEKLYLRADEDFKIHLKDDASFDPDGHPIVTSYWQLGENTAEKVFGEGLHPTMTTSGTYVAKLQIKDKYNKLSEIVEKVFYVFVSDRPEINKINISDGSNGELSTENLDPETWNSEVFPALAGESPKLPVAATNARVTFEVSDDSPEIVSYQLKVGGRVLEEQALGEVEKANGEFTVANFLNIASLNASGVVPVAFRVKDSTGTYSYWTDEIDIDFIDINTYTPEISNVILSNFSEYTNEAFNHTSPYYTGTFVAEVKLEDPYGNSRSVDNFTVSLGSKSIAPTNIVKIAGNRYKIYFTETEEMSNVVFSVQGHYGTNIDTNEYEIPNVTIRRTVLTFSADMRNSEYPDWWVVSLTGNSSDRISVDTGEEGTSAGILINSNYTSPFTAPIVEMKLKLNGNITSIPILTDDGTGSFESVRNFESAAFPDGDVTMSMQIVDDMGNTSEWSAEKTFKSLKINTYVPDVTEVIIADYQDKRSSPYKSGILNIRLNIDDFFSIFREPTTGHFNITPNSAPYNDEFVVTNIEPTFVEGTLDTTGWITQYNETITFNYNALVDYMYPAGKVSSTKTGQFKITAFSPHSIYDLVYQPSRSTEGNYIIHYDNSSDVGKFNIVGAYLKVQQPNASGTLVTTFDRTLSSSEILVDTENRTVSFKGPRIIPHEDTPVSVYLIHDNFVRNSDTYNETITINEPYPIVFTDVSGNSTYNRPINYEIDGYTRLFPTDTIINSNTMAESFTKFPFTMTYEDKNGNVHEYKTYNKMYISPKGAIGFVEETTTNLTNDQIIIPNTYVDVTSDDFGGDVLSILNGNYTYYNSEDSNSGIFYKINEYIRAEKDENGEYLLNSPKIANSDSLSIKFLNMCNGTFNNATHTCSGSLVSFEMTLYKNGSALIRYNDVSSRNNNITLGMRVKGMLDIDGTPTLSDIAYGQYPNSTLANKTIMMNNIPELWKTPPYIYRIEYTQADGISINDDGEVILAKYTVYFKNPDNADINALQAQLMQTPKETGEEITDKFDTSEGAITKYNGYFVFNSEFVIKRYATNIKVKARMRYDTDYFSPWYIEQDIEYIGPKKIGFTVMDPIYHFELTNNADMTGYTFQHFYKNGKYSTIGSYIDDWGTPYIDMGMEMDYFGEKARYVSISSNSLIKFRPNSNPSQTTVQTAYTASPVKNLNDNTFATLWYDLDFNPINDSLSSPCGVFTKFYESALQDSDDYFSIRFMNMTVFNRGSQKFSYEVRIYRDGRIRIHYSKDTPLKVFSGLGDVNTTIAFKKTIGTGYGSLLYPTNISDPTAVETWKQYFNKWTTGPSSYGYFTEPHWTQGKTIELDISSLEDLEV